MIIPILHHPRQGWKEEGGRWRGGAAAAEPGPAGEAEAGHGDAQHAKPECSQKRGRCKQEKLPILVNSTGMRVEI